MVKYYSALVGILLLLFLASCAKYMDETYIPSYVKIDEIKISTTGDQGTESSYFTDAWVYVDGVELGAYFLPSTIPILAGGEHRIKIAPGIKMNGVSETRVPYPMVEPIEYTLDLVKDSIQNLSVTTKYYETSKFALIEDFESANLAFETTAFNTAEWTRSHASVDPPATVFEGNYSGMGILDDENSYLQIITKKMFDELPKQGIPVFIELNFKTNTTIVLSLMSYHSGVGESKDLIYLSPTDEWKKIYINLTSTLSYDLNTNEYKFIFSANHTNGSEETIVLLDNFKVVYRDIE